LTEGKEIVSHLRQLLTADAELCRLAEQSLALAAKNNPHLHTNPVRTLADWFAYLERFLHRMPWQTMDIGEDASFFRRIDQNIGYFYYLLDQPLDALRDRGYWYPSLQYEPRIAAWLVEYNKAWGDWLSSQDSWNDSYYTIARTDARFGLDTGRYESPANWHSWNDFFARNLSQSYIDSIRQSIVNRQSSIRQFLSPSDGVIMDYPVKTMSADSPRSLLGDSLYADRFEGGTAIHFVLDVFDYHRFHAPCDGKIVEQKIIPGIHAGGGVIIWDESQGRYRYDQCGATGFQSLETRGVLVLDTPDLGLIALIAVGIQQVSSVQWSSSLSLGEGQGEVSQGEELGSFLFGGSDIILLFEPCRAPAFKLGKSVKVGEVL
jgi:phosphatidylserine decarboxylase